MHNRALKATALLLVLLFMLSGCRESQVIQETLYDQAAKEIDSQNKTYLANNIANSPWKDKELPKKKNDKSKRNNDDKKVAAETGKEKRDGEARNGDTNEEENNGKRKKPVKKPGNGDGSGGNGGDRERNESRAKPVEPPEKVDRVVAAGEAGILTQMLGGKDVLVGTSADLKNDTLASSAFGGQGLSKAQSLWSSSGSDPMSESSFQKLLKLQPDVCLEMPGVSTFSNSQLNRLTKAKIAWKTLPRLNIHDNIKSAVTQTADLLQDRTDRGGRNAPDIAQKYADYCEALLEKVKDKTGRFTWNDLDFNNDVNVNSPKKVSGTIDKGTYTLFLSGWDSDAKFKLSKGGVSFFDIKGVAKAAPGYSDSPLSYYMSMAGVCNNGAAFNREEKEWAAIPLNMNTSVPKLEGSSLKLYKPSSAESFAQVKNKSIYLGDSNFPAVVVDSKATKTALQKQQGQGALWSAAQYITVNGYSEYGYESKGILQESYIHNSYDIRIIPKGIGNWANGSVESVLQSIWTAGQFSSHFGEGDVKQEIKKFYSEFYDYNLSDDQVNRILEGM